MLLPIPQSTARVLHTGPGRRPDRPGAGLDTLYGALLMVRLRFKRFGRRHRPFYRLGAVDSRSPRNGRVIEELGWYDPAATRGGDQRYNFNAERIQYWLGVGASPSETVEGLLKQAGIITGEQKKAAAK